MTQLLLFTVESRMLLNFNPRALAHYIKHARQSLSLKQLRTALHEIHQSEDAIFCIVMPGGAHLAFLAAQMVSDESRVILIGNGINSAEKDWLHSKFGEVELIMTRQIIAHHHILDIFFDIWSYNFTIMDYDCFIMDHEVQYELCKTGPNDFCSSAFSTNTNPESLAIPETFLVHFNIALVKSILARWDIGSGLYRWPELPNRVVQQFKSFEFNENGYLDSHKDYFDTLRVIFLLAHLEGNELRIIRQFESFHGDPNEVFHIGSVSKPTVLSNPYSYAGSYFWSETLLAFKDESLINIAKHRYGENVLNIITQNHDRFSDDVRPELFAFTQHLCSKISM